MSFYVNKLGFKAYTNEEVGEIFKDDLANWFRWRRRLKVRFLAIPNYTGGLTQFTFLWHRCAKRHFSLAVKEK